jgi:hypothetical protein
LVIATPKLTHQIPHEKTQPVDISASRYGAWDLKCVIALAHQGPVGLFLCKDATSKEK